MILLLILFCAFCAIPIQAQVASNTVITSGIVTNKFLVSNTIEKKAWTRTAITASSNEVKDVSGQLVHSAESGAINSQAIHIGEISEAAKTSVSNSISTIYEYTNQVPENAYHIGISIPRQNEVNLSGLVIAESFDGTNDIQTVRYSQKLSKPPLRKVEYCFLSVTNSVKCIWEHPWNTNSFDHVCTIKRPEIFNGMKTTYKSNLHDVFGGPKGFSFGSSIISVDGVLTFTGEVTNKTNNAILVFENGVLTNEK